MLEPETVLCKIDTSYDQYQVVERTYEGRPARVLFSGSRRAAQSGIALDDSPDLLFDYNQRLLEICNALYPKSVLLIGGGAFTLPMALHAALPDASITVIELDEALEALAIEYFGLRTDDRLHVFAGDGRDFLQTTKTTYDLIIVDVFSELTIPKRFLTHEFVVLAHNRLNTGGSIAMNIIASLQGRTTGLIKSQLAAYRDCFDRVDLFPAAHGLTSWLPQNIILFAQKDITKNYKHYVRFAAVVGPSFDHDDIIYDQTAA